jgi:hypothetical protein
MSEARHTAQTILEGLHSAISFEYADSVERLAAGPFEAYDKYKLAIQLDTNEIYILLDTATISWGLVATIIV